MAKDNPETPLVEGHLNGLLIFINSTALTATINQYSFFLYVAQNPGTTATQLISWMNEKLESKNQLTRATVSNIVRKLSGRAGVGEPGPDLLRYELNKDNERERNLYLTKKGEALYKKIKKALSA